MATTAVSELINRTRRMVKDWPDTDALTTSISSTATLISVGDGTLYAKNFHVEIDSEVLTVSAAGSGTTFAARRGAWGSTAASHASTTVVLMRPSYPSLQILDALNQAKDEAFPLIYQPILDTSLTTLANTFEYTVPTPIGGAVPIQYISKVELKLSGNTDYSEVRGWSVRRGTTPKIQFVGLQEAGATVRVHGYSPFADLAYGGATDNLWPVNATNVLVVGAAAFLLMSGELGRLKVDTLPNDTRESANRVGSQMSASAALYSRFRNMCLSSAMPPLPRHAKPTF